MPTAVGVMADSYKATAAGPPLTGLVTWLDADDATTFSLTGTTVDQWRDKSSAAAHYGIDAASPAGWQPIRTVAALNGRAVVDFDTTSVLRSVESSGRKPFTTVSVQTFRTWGYESIVGPLNSGGLQIRANPSQKCELMAASQSLIAASTGNLRAGACVLTVSYSSVGAYSFYVDGVDVGSGTNNQALTAGDSRVGSGAGGEAHNGYIAELLKYDHVLDATERAQAETYLRTKWGITFDPLSIPWHSAFWASDPGWTPPADGGQVTTMRNAGTSAANATAVAGFTGYRAAYAALNGKPVFEFASNANLDTSTPSIAQPNHIVCVGWLDPTHGTNPTICDEKTAGSNRHMFRNTGASGALIWAGGSATSMAGAGRTGPYIMIALFDGASSSLRTNSTVYTPASTVGTNPCANLRIGRDAATAYYKGAIAFLGVSDTALTAQQISDLENWAKNFYGVPIP